MADVIERLDTDPCQALASYIQRLEKHYASWYDSASKWAYYRWLVTSWIAVLAGFLTTVIGILMDNDILTGPEINSTRLILPAVGSLAAVMLARFVESKSLRERGRQGIERIIAEGRREYAGASDAAAMKKVHDELIKRVFELEQEQLAGFVRSASGPGQRGV